MKRHSNRHQLRLISEVSITPMLDLVLVLLFVILLAVPVLKADKLAPPTTPPAPSIPVVAAPVETLTLSVNRDLSVTLNGAMLARADLPASLKKAAQVRPDVGVEVRMHRDLPVQHLVETMAMLDKAGIRKTAVVTHAEEF